MCPAFAGSARRHLLFVPASSWGSHGTELEVGWWSAFEQGRNSIRYGQIAYRLPVSIQTIDGTYMQFITVIDGFVTSLITNGHARSNRSLAFDPVR